MKAGKRTDHVAGGGTIAELGLGADCRSAWLVVLALVVGFPLVIVLGMMLGKLLAVLLEDKAK